MEQDAKEKKGEPANGDGNRNQVEDDYGDEDEDEDVDFNPSLKETPSREASSSLSSDIEGVDADIDSGQNAVAALASDSKAKLPNLVLDYPVVDTDPGEEIVTQIADSAVGESKKGSESGSLHGKNDGSGSQLNFDNDLVAGEFSSMAHSEKPVMNMDDEDAICMRTRARYSLASFTLDELETFLQETDDEDDLQNVNDEEEYRKFLAAVLQGVDGDPHSVQENENVDDEDEENDADFELEIEEALESDIDEDARDDIQEAYEAAGHRPKTRQNRHKKASVEGNKKLLGLSKRPLRPLLPNAPITQQLHFSTPVGKSFTLNNPADFLPSIVDGSINGFTPHQIGQLHCLIHEHVQLLIQSFSISVLEPSRRHIVAKVQELILEVLRVRDHVLGWRRLPYPSFCFFSPHVQPSVRNEVPRLLSALCINESSSLVDARRPSGNNAVHPDIISAPKGRRESLCNGQTPEGSSWMPSINGPVLSVVDVAPLKLVGNFVDDISAVVQEYHRRQVGLSCDTRTEKVPLFPLNGSPASTEPHEQDLRGTTCSTSNVQPLSPIDDRTPKKTMAAALVERAKKQSVALVPQEIAKLAQRFCPLFNPALYPHKPPPAPLANRVLFTDAEDELLALGLMEYNTDWKAIQQRFLPCKSKHQIFVRQKNRSSSKAPENPIKAVRRMKTSPLTTEEVARIEEGLKIFKLDWMSIWKFLVPYRDPSLLPRQWRIATGTQKSYKLDAKKKEKRKLYEKSRRNSKSAALANWDSSPEKEDNGTGKAFEENNNADNLMDREDEAYVHEAFLADWPPGTTNVSSEFPKSGLQETSPPIQPPVQEDSRVSEQLDRSRSGDAQTPTANELPAAVRSSKSQLSWRPYRARRVNNARVVKLSPDLPPVNLPPSVRVMSQSAFKNYQAGVPLQTCATPSVIGPGAECVVAKVVKGTANSGVSCPIKAGQFTGVPLNNNTSNHQPQDSLSIRNKHVEEEKDESDLQMHPLLFQAPDDGHFAYYPLHSIASTSSSFNFFARSPPQLNLSLFHNPRTASSAVNFLEKSLKTKESTSALQVDFHPLLQRSDKVDSSLVAACSAAQVSANPETFGARCPQSQNLSGVNSKKTCLNNSSKAASARPVSPNEKINELDLDIHLSFTSRQQKAEGSRDANECSIVSTSATDSSNLGSQKQKYSLNQSSQYMPLAYASERNNSKFNPNVHMVVVSSDEENRKNADNIIEDSSLPDIVMEQEELSDSDDEMGEKVEFEREEMADSEAEGSDSEQIIEMQNEEVENADADAHIENRMCEPVMHDCSEGNALRTIEDRTTDRKIDNSSASLCLNLNSCPPSSPLMAPSVERLEDNATTPNEKVHSSAGKAIENISSNDGNTATQEQVFDPATQPNLDSGISSLKKPRKRACGSDSRLSRGASKRRNMSSKTDTNSAKSKHISKGDD